MCNVPKNNAAPNEQHLINKVTILILEYGYSQTNAISNYEISDLSKFLKS